MALTREETAARKRARRAKITAAKADRAAKDLVKRKRLAKIVGECVAEATIVADRVRAGRVERRCKECGIWKELRELYSPRARNSDGFVLQYYYHCSMCRNAAARIRKGVTTASVPRGKASRERVAPDGAVERFCRRCDTWKVREGGFSPRKRVGGQVTSWDARCRPCRRVEQRRLYMAVPEEERRVRGRAAYVKLRENEVWLEARREKERLKAADGRAENPERERRRTRRYRMRLAVNPDRLEARREIRRLNYRMKLEEAGRPLPPGVDLVPPGRGHVEIGPFREWLQGQAESLGGTEPLAFAIGTSERRVYAWLHENELVSAARVDASVTAMGEPYMMEELYPVGLMGKRQLKWEPTALLREDLAVYGPDVFVLLAAELGVGIAALRAELARKRMLRETADLWRRATRRAARGLDEQQAA